MRRSVFQICAICIIFESSLGFFNPGVFNELSQMGVDQGKLMLRKVKNEKTKSEIDHFKLQYPEVFKQVSEKSNDEECTKIRLDSFEDCKLTMAGIKNMNLKEEEAKSMLGAVFSKCIEFSKELCPL